MSSIKNPEELDLIARQRTTGGRHGKFDASQFKMMVEQDVPPEVIEQLQDTFEEDMAGAIDKFHEMKKQIDSEYSSDLQPKTPNDEVDDGKKGDDSVVDFDPLGRKEFVIRDRYWDRSKRQWVIQKPAKAKRQSKKYKKCVIFVRRDYSDDMTSFDTALVISGRVLRNALRHIFRGVDGFGLTENESTELEPKYMFWARPELEALADHYRGIDDRAALFEINAALKFIDTEYKDMISVLPSMIPGSISFEYLWAILPPDCLVVGKNVLDYDGIWCVRSSSAQRTDEGIFQILNAEQLVWDGARAGNIRQTLRIPLFAGIKSIRELPYVPLRYHPQREAVMQRVLERSKKALEFWKPQFEHRQHHGTGLAEVYERVERYPFSGRVMIDPKMMRQMQPSNKVIPRSRDIGGLRKITRTCFSDLTTEEQKPGILQRLLTDATKALADDVDKENSGYDYANSDDEDSDASPYTPSESETKQLNLSEEQMLLVSGLLYGYSLREGTWGAFAVDQVSPITWNTTIFDSLVMDKTLKDVIYRLVVAHSLGTSDFDDFVKGKGKGLIGLLFGPPGSGKTLTAEAIAETAKMPLYAVSSGALGHEATQIHDRLSAILKLASHWKAVLLLDEADVFLAQRTLTDIVRNAIVSVFLRELEYYQGILLLTTNQADVIDEAFQSECHPSMFNFGGRIHLSLQYPSLDAAARFKIWKNFTDNARKCNGVEVDINDDQLRDLSEMHLNGRQIKNTVSIAVKIATTSDSHTITAANLKDTVRLLQSSQFSLSPSKKSL